VPYSAAGSSSGASASAAAPGGRGLHGERQRLHAVGRRDEAELRAVLLAVEVRLPHPELGRAVAAEPQQAAVLRPRLQRGVRPDHAEVLAEAVHKRQLAQRARVAAPLRSTPPSSRTAIASRRRAVVRSRHHLAGQGRAPSESPAAYCTVPLLASRLSSSRSSCPPPPPPPSAPARAAMALIAAIAVPSSRRGP